MKIANLLSAAAVLSMSSVPAFAEETSPVTVSALPNTAIAGCPVGGGRGHGPGQWRGRGGGGGGRGMMMKRLNLTEDQIEKIYQLRGKLADQTGVTKAEIAVQKRKIRDLLTQPSINRAAVEAAQAKINTLKTSMSNAKLAFKLDFSETLTAEQRHQLRFGKFGSRGPGPKVGELGESGAIVSMAPDEVEPVQVVDQVDIEE